MTIIRRLLKKLSTSLCLISQSMKSEEYIICQEMTWVNLHFSLGQGIRNEFGLWAGNEELLESCKAMAGKTDLHIDSASSVIIKALWERLRQFPPPKVVREGVTYEF